jgi:hypothetical protein
MLIADCPVANYTPIFILLPDPKLWQTCLLQFYPCTFEARILPLPLAADRVDLEPRVFRVRYPGALAADAASFDYTFGAVISGKLEFSVRRRAEGSRSWVKLLRHVLTRILAATLCIYI